MEIDVGKAIVHDTCMEAADQIADRVLDLLDEFGEAAPPGVAQLLVQRLRRSVLEHHNELLRTSLGVPPEIVVERWSCLWPDSRLNQAL